MSHHKKKQKTKNIKSIAQSSLREKFGALADKCLICAQIQ